MIRIYDPDQLILSTRQTVKSRDIEKKMTDIYPGLGEQKLKKIKNYDVIKILIFLKF